MDKVAQVVNQVQGLAERFLDAEVKTGVPDLNTDVGREGEAYDEVQSFMSIAQQSALNAYMAINQLLKPAHKDKLVTLFGEKAEDLLKQTKECLEGIAGLFDVESEEEVEEEPEEEEKPSEEEDEDEGDEEEDEEEKA